MKLPNQNPGVDRSNRLSAAKAAGVQPAFWGGVLDVLKKGAQGALQGVLG